jgi:hypothetical protein
MPEFIRSGRVIDLALSIVVLELAVLLVLRAWGRRALGTPDVLANLAAAAGLLAAAHLLIARDAWLYPALALGAAWVAHIAALRYRWRKPRPATPVVAAR